MSRSKEVFQPMNPPRVTLYVCGVTVYDYSHLGHARAYVSFDVLYRLLCTLGYDVLYVRNFTDIDDKIIKRANELQETPEAITSRFIQAFNEDMESLGCASPSLEPKATDYVPQMIQTIQRILDKGHGYEDNGDVFFDTMSIANYGSLSKRRLDDNRPGERVSVDGRKRSPTDFSLWKAAKPGEPSWPSPWGPGRPGWHIECSAMIRELIGITVDIHGGGSDLIFPHHENELAQSQAAAEPCDKELMINGTDFVRYWMHNGFVTIGDEKMSKSLGNFSTIREVLELHHPLTLRWMLLSSQYRQQLNYTEQSMQEAASNVYYLYQTLVDAMELVERESRETRPGIKNLYKDSELVREVVADLCDDVNGAAALGSIYARLKRMNDLMHTKKGRKDKSQVVKLRRSCWDVCCCLEMLGFEVERPQEVLQEMRELTLKRSGITEEYIRECIQSRKQARASKDYYTADEIRLELNEKGIAMCDSPEGTTWRPL